jgi:hypothetical protein
MKALAADPIGGERFVEKDYYDAEMPNDPVHADVVAAADRFVRGVDMPRALRRLERSEPGLAEYLMEAATRLYTSLDRACPSHRRLRAIHAEAVLLALVCIEAVRRST